MMIKLRMLSEHSKETCEGCFNEGIINYVEIYDEVNDKNVSERKNILNYCGDKSTDFYIDDESVEKLKLLNGFATYPRFDRHRIHATVLINNNNIFGICDGYGETDNILFKDGSHITVKHLEKEYDKNDNLKAWYYKTFVSIK